MKLDLADLGMHPSGEIVLANMNAATPDDVDSNLYLRLNPDIAAAEGNAVDHYVRYDIAEGRQYC